MFNKQEQRSVRGLRRKGREPRTIGHLWRLKWNRIEGQKGGMKTSSSTVEMDDDMIQKMMHQLRYILEVNTGRKNTPAFEAF